MSVRLSDGFVSHSSEVQQSLVLLRQYYVLLNCPITTVRSANLSQSTSQKQWRNCFAVSISSIVSGFHSTVRCSTSCPLQQCEMPVSSVGSTVRVSDGFVSHSTEVQQFLVLIRQYNAPFPCAITTVWSAGISQSNNQAEWRICFALIRSSTVSGSTSTLLRSA